MDTIPEILKRIEDYANTLLALASIARTQDEPLSPRESGELLNLTRKIGSAGESLHSRVCGNPPPRCGP
jgi:hypothetical protein